MNIPNECHGLDTPERVCFYEQDFYVLSNFSAFTVKIGGRTFPTSEHAYHFFKFKDHAIGYALAIFEAPSAHEAFKIAERHKADRRSDWDDVKVEIMRGILRAKVAQHEYVRRKLLATGDRELVENSWRDDFWGWGPNRDGRNALGKLWMEIRAELQANPPLSSTVALTEAGRELLQSTRAHKEPHLIGKHVTVVYRIEDPTAWRATNPMQYAHDGLKAETVSIGDVIQTRDNFRTALERIAEDDFEARDIAQSALDAEDAETAKECGR